MASRLTGFDSTREFARLGTPRHTRYESDYAQETPTPSNHMEYFGTDSMEPNPRGKGPFLGPVRSQSEGYRPEFRANSSGIILADGDGDEPVLALDESLGACVRLTKSSNLHLVGGVHMDFGTPIDLGDE